VLLQHAWVAVLPTRAYDSRCFPRQAAGSLEAMRAIKSQVAASSAVSGSELEEHTRLFAQLWGAGANRDAVQGSAKGRSD